MNYDGTPPRPHLRTVDAEPPFDPDYDRPGRRPPADRDAELAVLAALLHHPEQAPTITELLEGPDFFYPVHEQIWDAWHHLQATDGHAPDPVTLNAHLIRTRNTDAARVLADTITTNTAPGLATKYAEIVRDHARLRSVSNLAAGFNDLVNRARVDDIENTLGEALQRLDETVMRFGARPTLTTPTTWAPVDLGPVLAGEHLDPPPTMLMRADGVFLLYDGAVHTIAGESESGKTWLTLIAALQLMAAGEHVTFLDFEDRADRVIGRLLALGATPTQIRDHFAYVRPDRPLDDTGRAQLAPAITGRRLVIVDGVTEAMTIHGYARNSNADSALFQALIPRWIADHGPAVVLIDHVVKDKEKQDRFALGAQHKLAGIDGVAYIVKMLQPFARGKRGLAKVEIAKDRPGHVREHAHGKTIAEFTLDATGPEHILLATLTAPGTETGRTGDTFEPTHLMEKISRYVQANPGMSKKAIEGAMNGKATTIRLALELLVTRQYIGIKTGPRGAVQHFHNKPYYQADDTTPEDSEGALDDPENDPTDTTQEPS